MLLFNMNRDESMIWGMLPDYAFGLGGKALSDTAQRWFGTFAKAMCDISPRKRRGGNTLSDKYQWFIDPETTYQERKNLIEKYCAGCEKREQQNKEINEVAIVDATPEDIASIPNAISAATLGSYDRNFDTIDTLIDFASACKRFEEWADFLEQTEGQSLAFLLATICVAAENNTESMIVSAKATLDRLFEQYSEQDLAETIKTVIGTPGGRDYVVELAGIAAF